MHYGNVMQLSDLSFQIASWLAVTLLGIIGYLAKDMRSSMKDIVSKFEIMQRDLQGVRERIIKLETRGEINANNKAV